MVSDKKARLETMVNVTVLICQPDIYFCRKSESFYPRTQKACIFKKLPIFFRKRQQQTPQIELLLHLTFIPQFALAENFYEMCKFPAEASPPSKILNYENLDKEAQLLFKWVLSKQKYDSNNPSQPPREVEDPPYPSELHSSCRVTLDLKL